MNGYERIMTALKREQPDRVAIFELVINEPVIKALYPDLSLEGARFARGTQGAYQILAEFIEREDIDAITIFEDFRPKKWIDGEHYVDEWNITWRVPSTGIPYVVGHPSKVKRTWILTLRLIQMLTIAWIH